MTEPPEFDPRAPLAAQHRRADVRVRRKSFRQWISEPGAKPALLVTFGFFALIYGFCLFSALMLGHYGGVHSITGLLLLSLAMFATIWLALAVGPKIIAGEGGILDSLVSGMLRQRGKAPELDESPARLARKRGAPEEALRLYRQWTGEFPHRLDLRFHIADIEHNERGDAQAGLRGYRDFLRRLDAADREPTPLERPLIRLAEAHIADIEQADKEPPPRRVIKI